MKQPLFRSRDFLLSAACASAFGLCTPGAVLAATVDTTANTACATASQFFLQDTLSGIQSPCAIAPGQVMVESMYLQNASAVGGTALAIYPMFRLRTGITDRVQFALDTPSQIAESGRAGIGLYPSTRLGVGVDYTFAQGDRFAVAAGVEALPPISPFATTQKQAKYALDLSSGYRLTPRVTLQSFLAQTSTSGRGFTRLFPSAVTGIAYEVASPTQVSFDVGAREFVHRANPQYFGTGTLDQRLSKKLTFDVGLGTAFNPISNAKAHYLASGLNYHF